jgi:5'-nucleotidase (lipoprotein e(P4) family)
MTRRWPAAVSILVFVAGCRTAGPVGPPAPDPAALARVPGGVRWVRNSAEYIAAAVQAYGMATRRVDIVAASRPQGGWAVAMDADETVLDNSQYQMERAMANLPYTSESWTEWVQRRQARAVPGAAAFIRRVKETGGRIVIVTNRTQAQCADTEENFRALNLAFDAMLCKEEGGNGDKEPRFDRVAAGTAKPGLPPLEIVLWVGDNIQDFPEQRQAMRKAIEGTFQIFGHAFIILPNPMYGSWEKNPVE